MKKIIILILLVLSGAAYGQLDSIKVNTPNSGLGDKIRVAFQKTNLSITQVNTNTGNILLRLPISDTTLMLTKYARKASPTFTGTVSGITAAMTGAMSTSHAANAITGTDITNWGTAYSDRLKWDGGSTGLTAATGRTSLGGTTAGQALFTLTNPSAITFLRINADNTVTALSAANFKTALSLSASDVSLGNVTNESKATMFTNPVFTGVQKVSTTDTLSTKAYARSVGLGGGGGVSEATVSAIVSDSITARLNGATEISDVAVMLADSTAGAGHYASHYDMTTGLAGKVTVSDTSNMLANYINKADTANMLTPYARKKSPTFNTIVKLDSDTLATRAYARSYGGSGTVTISDVQDEIADSLNALRPLVIGINDIKPYFVFGAGTGTAADSTLFAKGNKSFGSFRIIEDSLYVHSITNLYMTSGDSLKFNVYYGNGMTRTATDSLFTAPQGAGSYATQTLTPDNERTINHGQDVWVGIIGPQPANMRPKEWILQLNAKIVRD